MPTEASSGQLTGKKLTSQPQHIGINAISYSVPQNAVEALREKSRYRLRRRNLDNSKMRAQTVEELRAGEYQGTKKLKLVSCDLYEFPREILDLADSLELLDLSSNPLSQLPEDFHRLQNLKIAFFSDCNFATFPKQLAQCSSLEMIAFRGNAMTTIPEHAFPPQLRWLILTNNLIRSLPESIGKCLRLQKVMLAGNHLTTLPDEMADCTKLGLLRLSANKIAHLPPWLFALPELAFLSLAGNPCTPSIEDYPVLDSIAWSDLTVNEILGEGASGVISKGVWKAKTDEDEKEVAIKLFKGAVTSDGSPADEMTACITAGSHPNLIDPIAKIHDHPDGKPGLVLQLIPPHYANLGLPPTLQSCTRDAYPPGMALSVGKARTILRGVASAAAHLHARGIAHGDLYAHNVLIDDAGHALLGDFGAATNYREMDGSVKGAAFERLDVCAFGHLIEDLVGLVDWKSVEREMERVFLEVVSQLQDWCTDGEVMHRPLFTEVCLLLEGFEF